MTGPQNDKSSDEEAEEEYFAPDLLPTELPSDRTSPVDTVKTRDLGSDEAVTSPPEQAVNAADLDSIDAFPVVKKLGKYVLKEKIGRGGMGVVWKAFDPDLRRTIAIKVLGPNLAHSERARLRFQREARAAAAINHPNTLTVHSVEEHSGILFLVMEYVSGHSLKEFIAAKGKIEPAEVIRIGLQIAQGLAAAHAQGVIHRDIKPGNVMLHEGATLAQLSDFGLARVAMDNSDLSSHDQCVGTPSYMSPEMLRGDRIDARSDLFGLGCVFYQMLMGHSPFQGRSQGEVILRILDTTPKNLHALDKAVPPVLSEIVGRLLEKDPELRFQSAAEVADTLGRLQRQLNMAHSDEFKSVMAGTTVPHNARHRWSIGLSVSVLVVIAAVLTYRYWPAAELKQKFDLPESVAVDTKPDSIPTSQSNSVLPTKFLAKYKEITVGSGSDADFSTISQAVMHADAGATITVRGPGPFSENVVISGSNHHGIRLLASPRAVWRCDSSVEPCSLRVDDCENLLVQGFDFEVAPEDGRAIQVLGDARNVKIEDCGFSHTADRHRLSLILVGTSPRDDSSIVEIQGCRFSAAGGTAMCIALGPVGAASRVSCTSNLFRSPGTHIYCTEDCRQVLIKENIFVGGTNAINMSIKKWYPDSRVVITNNTFVKNRFWLGLMDSFRNTAIPNQQTRSMVCNNLILGGERVLGGEDQWKIARTAWTFKSNWWERDQTTRPENTLDKSLAEFHEQLDILERENIDSSNYLRPAPESALLTAGVGDDLPRHIGAVNFTDLPGTKANDLGNE